MKKSLALIMSLIMIFSTFSVCTVSANAATAPAAVSTQTVELENNFSLMFKGMFRDILNSFMKHFGVKKGFYVTDVDIAQSKATIDINEKVQLKATLEPENVKNNTITWKSDNILVATVNSNGTVTGKKAGTTTIYAIAEDGKFYDKCSITVNGSANYIPCTGLTVSKSSVSLKNGQSATVKITKTPSNTSDTITLYNSNANVINISLDSSNNAIIKAVGEGTATITVKCGSKTAEIKVTVDFASGTNHGSFTYKCEGGCKPIYSPSYPFDKIGSYCPGHKDTEKIERTGCTNVVYEPLTANWKCGGH